MTDVPFPLLSAPGQHPQVSGGRLVNCYPEPLAQTAGKPYAYWRVPGLNVFATTPAGSYRGGILVGGTFYALFGTTVYTFTSLGGAGVALAGSIPGSQYCWFAANQNSPPDIVVVSPGIGAFVIVSTGVANYPDSNVGTPNSVVYLLSFFIFTYGNCKSVASNTDVLTSPPPTGINPVNFAYANSKPDALWRPLPLGNGQLLLCGANTIEVWGGNNPTGYPFSYVSTIYRGIPGPQAIAGNEDGWGKGIFFVGDDNKVSTLTTYTPTPISIPDIDQLIEKEPDKTKIIVGVYVARGHGFVVVQGPTWCWEYDTTLQSWHERRSYLQSFWRGYQPICLNFGSSPLWVCGDVLSSSLLKIDGTVFNEVGNPLRMRVETGPLGAFPQKIRVNTIELYMTKGAGVATAGYTDALGFHPYPEQVNPMVGISMSRDAGLTWGTPRQVAVGQQMLSPRARASVWGQADIQGVRWRFEESAGVNFAFMGADMLSDTLR
jgi:hypothetical protein